MRHYISFHGYGAHQPARVASDDLVRANLEHEPAGARRRNSAPGRKKKMNPQEIRAPDTEAQMIPHAPAQHPHLDRLVLRARQFAPLAVAIVYPCDRDSLAAAVEASRENLVMPLLVGPRGKIEAQAKAAQLDIAGFELADVPGEPSAAAREAVALCRAGRVRALMKGSLHTDELLGAAVSKEGGLRGARRISHVFVIDVPGHPRPLLIADAVVNITPNLAAKRDIVQNAVEFAHAIGIAVPRVAILSAVETVNPAIAGSVDAQALCAMAKSGEISGAILDGPFAMDNAIYAEAARIKGIKSEVAGRPDILLVPGLEAGNILYKALVYLAGGACAGLVLGAKVPIILTSRADSIYSRVASCALASLLAQPTKA
jgi:phosphate acetyltransferase